MLVVVWFWFCDKSKCNEWFILEVFVIFFRSFKSCGEMWNGGVKCVIFWGVF